VKVIAPQQPMFSAAAVAGNVFQANVSGDGGPDYTVFVSTNLQTWEPLFTTSGVSGPFQFGFTSPASTTQQFYRIRLEP
jgi:hypothetical protein